MPGKGSASPPWYSRPKCPPFENREGWGSLFRGDAQTEARQCVGKPAHKIPTSRKERETWGTRHPARSGLKVRDAERGPLRGKLLSGERLLDGRNEPILFRL
jgi:hypothetical protein